MSHLIEESTPLLSSCPGSSDDEGNARITSKCDIRTTTRRNRRQHTILLERSGNKERFTFGRSLHNELVLRHSLPTDQEWYHINLLHTQLYPDPDRDSLVLFNSSISPFNVRLLTKLQAKKIVLPGQEARLDCGNWQLMLGED